MVGPSLKNRTCIYCGTPLKRKQNMSRDHVIAREFVPVGTFKDQWNLHAGACISCNGNKARLEDDISAITMQPDTLGQFAHTDPRLRADAERKGKKSGSAHTGRSVNRSTEQLTLRTNMGPEVTATFGAVAPPHVGTKRLLALAELQIRAFIYWLTFDEAAGVGYPPAGFQLLRMAAAADWGNVVHLAFMRTVVSWPQCLVKSTAEGFFKVAIRRHPSVDCWAWALEWNFLYRLVGFTGDLSFAERMVAEWPSDQKIIIAQSAEGRPTVSITIDRPLAESDDLLFFDDDRLVVPEFDIDH